MPYAKVEDQKRAARAHYLANKQLYKDRARVSNDKTRAQNRANLLAYLLAHPCVDCGEPDPVVLQFDHISDDKVAGVARLLAQAKSWKRIIAEIEKCEVVCANCHARRTARRHGGWFKARSQAGMAEKVDAPASSPCVL